MHVVYLIVAMLLNAGANILLKMSARTAAAVQSASFFEYLHAYKLFIVGALLFACNIIFYFLAMKSLPLSLAYPIMVGGGFLIVGTSAVFLFHESISTFQILGYCCIVLGIVLVVSYAK